MVNLFAVGLFFSLPFGLPWMEDSGATSTHKNILQHERQIPWQGFGSWMILLHAQRKINAADILWFVSKPKFLSPVCKCWSPQQLFMLCRIMTQNYRDPEPRIVVESECADTVLGWNPGQIISTLDLLVGCQESSSPVPYRQKASQTDKLPAEKLILDTG